MLVAACGNTVLLTAAAYEDKINTCLVCSALMLDMVLRYICSNVKSVDGTTSFTIAVFGRL
jgi:hypothetical protein